MTEKVWVTGLGFATSIGNRREEVVGQKVASFYAESTLRDLEAGRRKMFADMAQYTNAPREMRAKDGTIIEVLSSAVVDRDDEGRAAPAPPDCGIRPCPPHRCLRPVVDPR